MTKRGISGGLITITSFLDGQEREVYANNAMIKTSSSIREAAKIGLQSLYASADKVLDKYKDFDIVKEMKSRKDAKLLWVRARAIDADVVNTNGDYFSEEELTKEMDYQGKKMPAYKTFEGVPIYTNHKNDNIEEAKGMVVYAEWDDEEKCVYCVFFVDEEAYPDIARGIRLGYLHDVSMGASVDLGICSICGNEATTESQYCECLKKYKGRMHPSGKKTFEYNYGIKFIELSCVGDGAFESCEIEEIYDQEELIEKAKSVVKAARSLNSSICLANFITEDYNNRNQVETALRKLQELNNDFIKIAQSAGTLVGGQILGAGTVQNATVVKILQGLGIDPSSNLNILDLVNLALNFLEVAVLNLFSRKDNIDLSHVAKLTKAMGELQGTLQDMIDDGIETGSRNQNPMVPPSVGQPPQGQPGQQQSPQANQPAVPQAPAQDTQTTQFDFNPMVGKVVSPFSQGTQMPIGGGVVASEGSRRIVWASTNKEIDGSFRAGKINKLGRFALALDELRKVCDIPLKNNDEVILDLPQKNSVASSGDINNMEHFKKIAQDFKNQKTVAVSVDINVSDTAGNRVVLSTDKGIKGFHNGKLTNWSPNLSDTQIAQMENGNGYKVAADLLTEFGSVVKTAEAENKIDFLVAVDESLEKVRENELVVTVDGIKDQYKGHKDSTIQEKLEDKRTNEEKETVLNELIGEERTSELVHIITELSNAAKKSLGDTPLELMLHPEMKRSSASGKKVMNKVVQAIAKTCSESNSKPKDVLGFLTTATSNKEFGKILKLARLGTKSREFDNLLSKFAQSDSLPEPKEAPELESEAKQPMPPIPPAMGENVDAPEDDMPMEGKAIEDIADTVDPEMSEGDIMSALTVIKENFEEAVAKLDEILNSSSSDANEPDDLDEMKDVLKPESETEEDIDGESMKGAVTGLSLAGEESEADPEEIVDTVNKMPIGDLSSGIQEARKPSFAKNRAKIQKSASSRPISENIICWLADVANHESIPTENIALAAKLFCSYKEAASNILKKSIKTSEVKVTDETTHVTTIYGTIDEIGIDVKDSAFNDKFREFAVNLLSGSGYEVDPMTFALTDIEVSADGMVCGKVSTRALKTFIPDTTTPEALPGEYVDEDREMVENTQEPLIEGMEGLPQLPEGGEVMTEEVPQQPENVVMSESAKSARRLARLKNVVKIAQGLGLPGAAAPAGGAGTPAAQAAGGADPLAQDPSGMAGGMADLGLGSLTGASPVEGEGLNESPEPGSKAPWGTICPQCGSKDVDVANGEGTCNSCQANLKYKFIVEVAPPEDGANAQTEINPENPAEPGGELGAEAPATPEAAVPGAAGAAYPAPTPGAGMPQVTGLPAAASNLRVMTRVAYKTTADVYANALSDNFNKEGSHKLPVGMICPACGSKTASKKAKHTYCYNCDTISVSEIKRVEGEPGVLEANIVWI